MISEINNYEIKKEILRKTNGVDLTYNPTQNMQPVLNVAIEDEGVEISIDEICRNYNKEKDGEFIIKIGLDEKYVDFERCPDGDEVCEKDLRVNESSLFIIEKIEEWAFEISEKLEPEEISRNKGHYCDCTGPNKGHWKK